VIIKNLTATKFVFLYFLSIGLLSIVYYASQLDFFSQPLSFSSAIASIAFFDRFFIEILICMLISIWLVNAKYWFLRVASYILAFVFLGINYVQLGSIYLGKEFFSPLAFENINHISLVLTPTNILGFIAFIIVFSSFPFLIEKKFERNFSIKPLIKKSIILILIALTFQQSEALLPNSILDIREDYFRKNYIGHSSPLAAAINTLFPKSINIKDIQISQEDIRELKKYGFNLNIDNQFPLIKKTIYNSPIPFAKTEHFISKPNIIVFMTEGFSARMINAYGSPRKDLTSNIDDFAKQAMVVKNYYNHTTSTYRGLHGQFCSLYPTYGGVGGWHTNYEQLPNTSYLCLSDILDKNKYETIFWDCHKRDSAFVDEMMYSLNFKKVWNAEDMSKEFLDNEEPIRRDSVSDHQLIRALIKYLDAKHENEEPFFIGIYNLGTHAFQNVTTDGKKYADGKNRALDTIHNLDDAFGLFWDYFKKSKYLKNTILIFTADHCHYMEPAFIQVAGPNYQKVYVDQVPLIIYDPGRKLPKEYDANYATSIDFTPSLLHLLGFPNHKNPFLGTSIFDTNIKTYEGVGFSSMGKKHFLIDESGIYYQSQFADQKYKDRLDQIIKFIHYSQYLEKNNWIWSRNFDTEIKTVIP